MADNTKIEWTRGDDGTPGASWNPIIATTGYRDGTVRRGWFCVHASDGCKNCYAEALNKRLGNGEAYHAQNQKHVTIEIAQGGQSGIDWPVRAKKPRRIFVCSMTDLFGEWVPDEMIAEVFAIMAVSQQHTFQVLTKRAQRMKTILNDDGFWDVVQQMIYRNPRVGENWKLAGYPNFLRNVWLGVSAEDQKTAGERIPHLLHTSAAIRWISYEPAIGAVDFAAIRWPCATCGDRANRTQKWCPQCLGCPQIYNCLEHKVTQENGRKLDWIVVGGESGARARPFRLEWVRDTINQCREAGVPCFVKQLGGNPIGPVCVTHYPPAIYRDGPLKLRHAKGGDIEEWPEDLRVRQYPP